MDGTLKTQPLLSGVFIRIKLHNKNLWLSASEPPPGYGVFRQSRLNIIDYLGTQNFMMTATFSKSYFIAALELTRAVRGYSPGTGSFAAGNLSTAAPYGIPPDEFTAVTSENVFSTATFNITGYSMSKSGETIQQRLVTTFLT